MKINGLLVSDTQIRDDVFREVRSDSRIKGADLEVAVHEGTVVLTGTVANAGEVLAAVEAARRADGVFEVVNKLQVKLPGDGPYTDAKISAAVQQMLEWDTQLPNRRIQVAVSNGWVALQGKVDLVREREDAERLVRRLEGVRGVYNMIEVAPPAESAENVRDAIERALEQEAKREAGGINVSLKDGTVKLSGKVHTWAAKQVILGALHHTPGVCRVNDDLCIDPYF